MAEGDALWEEDFDGDGTVYCAEIVKASVGNQLYLQLTFNSGNHLTSVFLGKEDFEGFMLLLGKAGFAFMEVERVVS